MTKFQEKKKKHLEFLEFSFLKKYIFSLLDTGKLLNFLPHRDCLSIWLCVWWTIRE